jgi:hypothetical protein
VRHGTHFAGVGAGRFEKSQIKPWLSDQWSIPPKQSAEFVWRMEDVLSVYTRPYDERFPQVCLDEKSKQLLGDIREPLRAGPGRPVRRDYEYEREGKVNLFIVSEPLRGWRHVSVTERRTKIDWAHCLKELADVHYPHAERIVLVMDNLNTHTPAALYEAFTPEEAGRIARKLEIHYTPKHGSWLNMAEIELSVLARQCLGDRRISDRGTLAGEVGAWEAERNASESSIDWRFITGDARIKLKHLYPEIVEEPSYDPNPS